MGNTWGIALALRDLASVLLVQDELTQAQRLCEEGLVINQELGERRGMAHCLAILAGIAARHGAAGSRAAILVGATDALLAATHTRLWTMQQRIYEQAARAARAGLGPAQFEAAARQGRALSPEQAVAYALAEGDG